MKLNTTGRPYITPIEEDELPPEASVDTGEDPSGPVTSSVRRGRSPFTGFMTMASVGAVVASVVAVVLLASFLVWYFA